MSKCIVVPMVLAAVCAAAVGDVAESRLAELADICAYEPCDDLEAKEVIPTPDDVIRQYGVTTNEVVRDLWTLTDRCSPSETNREKRIVRIMALVYIGRYGGTNDLPRLSTIMTNSADFAQEQAMLAGFSILKHSPRLIPFVRDVVTNTGVYSLGMRRAVYIRLLDICTEHYTVYLNDPAQEARIAAFFIERAAAVDDCSLFVDRCAYTLNPSYRHSQQRRDNLAALRPPNLTGKPAELYDARQRDAAGED